MTKRQAQIRRITNETRIVVKLKIDGVGKCSIRTGIAFFDHMLTLFGKHAVIDLVPTSPCDYDVCTRRGHQ